MTPLSDYRGERDVILDYNKSIGDDISSTLERIESNLTLYTTLRGIEFIKCRRRL